MRLVFFLMSKEGLLVLEDNSEVRGFSFGFPGSVSGEVVFNTGMVGYPESLTDPSYRGQILVLTYPLIGNYGIPAKSIEDGLFKNFESEKIQIAGLVVADYSGRYSHWNAVESLYEWLTENKIPAITGVDTRMLTKKLREQGSMLGKLEFGKKMKFDDPNERNLVAEVSCEKPIVYGEGKTKVALVDCGVKYNIIRLLLKRDATVIRVPWDYDFVNSSYDFDGVVISNGPGNPKFCEKTVENVKKAMDENIPVFGICMGNQILALAAGADTYKMKYGHRSQNQPCFEVGTKRCFITSQNHGFATKKKLPANWKPWFVNANDGTIEGIRHAKKPFMSVQFHPEATPGPMDTGFLFDEFLNKVRK